MYAGRILEAAPSTQIYENSQHPYTKVLLKSAPSIARGINDEDFYLDLKVSDLPDPENPSSGCLFHTRCVYADEQSKKEVPEKMQEKSR